jgi:hypothetical protein
MKVALHTEIQTLPLPDELGQPETASTLFSSMLATISCHTSDEARAVASMCPRVRALAYSTSLPSGIQLANPCGSLSLRGVDVMSARSIQATRMCWMRPT